MADKPFKFDPLSEEIDRKWAGRARDGDLRFNNYYDYYYSGEDVKIYIDGLFSQADELDIASFAYSVRQEKQPLYGFWSYNYDTIMFGTRIIAGEFSLYTRYPRRMTELLEKAALARHTDISLRKPENAILTRFAPANGSSEDKVNVMKYWGMTQLDRVTYDPNADTNSHIFSAHPPFNFIILLGTEEVALSPLSSSSSETFAIQDDLDRMIYSDVNERMVKLDNLTNPMKIVLQQVSLTNMTSAYTPGGQPLVESYQFIARDYYYTETDMSFIKQLPAFVQNQTTPQDPDELVADNVASSYNDVYGGPTGYTVFDNQ